jgi:hypothetical protein
MHDIQVFRDLVTPIALGWQIVERYHDLGYSLRRRAGDHFELGVVLLKKDSA